MSEIPQTYQDFIARYPKLGQAWELTAEAGDEGPLEAKSVRLIKLAISMGALREGAVHAGVRKALLAGVSKEAVEQVTALAAGTLGFPATVALFSWVREELSKGRAS